MKKFEDKWTKPRFGVGVGEKGGKDHRSLVMDWEKVGPFSIMIWKGVWFVRPSKRFCLAFSRVTAANAKPWLNPKLKIKKIKKSCFEFQNRPCFPCKTRLYQLEKRSGWYFLPCVLQCIGLNSCISFWLSIENW